MPLTTGFVLVNRYRVVSLLGQGGFGAVYRAWDINLNRPCAVKENLEISPEAQRQFAREAIVLANLSHPNLVRVTDHFIIEAQGQYLVMDFIQGEDLESMVKRTGPVPPEKALVWINQVANALEYLHTRQPPVVHRDIKPANIRITPEGQAVLVDFGLVKVYDPKVNTTAGARAITPGYSPPEQYGKGATDRRTDIYALGATLYTLLTGQEPTESVQRMMGEALVSANQVNPAIPPPLSDAINQAMALTPSQRFQSMEEFKAALKAGAPPAVPIPVPSAEKSTKSALARFWWLALIPLLLVICGVIGWNYGDQIFGLNRPRDPTATKAIAIDPTETLTPTATQTLTPTLTATETATLAYTPTQTQTSTATASATVTGTATPTGLASFPTTAPGAAPTATTKPTSAPKPTTAPKPTSPPAPTPRPTSPPAPTPKPTSPPAPTKPPPTQPPPPP
jgi:serine/threonine protein kinase